MNNKQIAEMMKKLTDLRHLVHLMGTTQLKILDYLGSKDDEFRAEIVAHFLADEKVLKGFTEHINEKGTDEEKTFIMSINEIWNDTIGQEQE
tara:strand:- start:160 stop:435 length:276 start_codon:yes stop_codon:yes gene_type:complete